MSPKAKYAALLTICLAACGVNENAPISVQEQEHYCAYELDIGMDGRIEERSRVKRNDSGLVTEEEIEYVRPGQVTESELFIIEYPNGSPSHKRTFYHRDDIFVNETEVTYDSTGRLLHKRVIDPAGTLRTEEINEYKNSLLVRNEVYSALSASVSNAELTLSSYTTWEHSDDSGKLFKAMTYKGSDDSLSQMTRQVRLDDRSFVMSTYNHVEVGDKTQNIESSRELNTFSESGRLIETRRDPDLDGRYEEIERFSYNARGDRFQNSIERDGQLVVDTTYHYNDRGGPTKVVSAGRVPSTKTFIYDCDDSKGPQP